MDMDSGLLALIGVASFSFVLLAFVALRRVNRFLIFLLAIAFACFGLSLGLIAAEDFQQGVAHVPSGRYTNTEITRGEHPTAFSISTVFVWVCTAGLLLMSLYLFSISLMRRRA